MKATEKMKLISSRKKSKKRFKELLEAYYPLWNCYNTTYSKRTRLVAMINNYASQIKVNEDETTYIFKTIIEKKRGY